MTRVAVPEPASLPEPAPATPVDQGGVPGLRTMRSPVFRTTVAAVLLLIGVSLIGMLLLRQASAEDGQFAIDFGAYYAAAERAAGGEPIYAAEMLTGPVDAQGLDQYLYPPLFAQLLQPLTATSRDAAALVWFALQAIAMYAAMWIGTGVGGARRDAERALWCGVAAVYFLPVFDTLWKGNVSAVLALGAVAVAVGGTAAGIGAGAGALLKAVPGTLVPAALLADRRSLVAVIGTLGLGLVVSFALAPSAWLDYPTVVRNMLAGSSDYATNLAPAASFSGTAADALRVATLGIAALSLGGSAWMARTRPGLPVAALLGVVAMLLIPASLWYHYLVVLLPFAAMAWPRAGRLVRVLLFVSAATVTLGLAWLPAAMAGATGLAAVSLLALWPRARGIRPGTSEARDHGAI